jgi:hypothetical protein
MVKISHLGKLQFDELFVLLILMESLDDLVRFFLSALGDEPTRREWKDKHPTVFELVNALRKMEWPTQAKVGR